MDIRHPKYKELEGCDRRALFDYLYVVHAVTKLRTIRTSLYLKALCEKDKMAFRARHIIFKKVINITSPKVLLPIKERLTMIRSLLAAGIDPNYLLV